MSQQEVSDTLRKNGELTAGEIAKILKANARGVRECLKRMLKHHEVEKIELTRDEIIKLGKSFSGRHFVWVLIE